MNNILVNICDGIDSMNKKKSKTEKEKEKV